jgi:hypothetical protein
LKIRSSEGGVALESEDELGSTSPSSGKEPKAKARKPKTKRASSGKKKTAKKEPEAVDTSTLATSPTQPSISPPFAEDEDTGEPAQQKAEPFYVIGGAGVSRSDDDTSENFESQSQTTPQFSPSSSPEPSVVGQGQYHLVFVNTPAQSLMKTKVQVDFDTFSTVAIGREAENVIVIPDTEVSRTHAELSLDGNRVMLKDRGSTNGTFLYDGREFQRVTGSVEVKPNSMIKFGNNTIVKLTCE